MADDTPDGQEAVLYTIGGERAALRKKHKKRIASLETEIGDSIRLDEPLPTGEILRYMTEVGLMELQTSGDLVKVHWFNSLLRVMKLEATQRAAMTDEEKDANKAILVNIFQNASERVKKRRLEDEASEALGR